jgi:hypothetical protein
MATFSFELCMANQSSLSPLVPGGLVIADKARNHSNVGCIIP